MEMEKMEGLYAFEQPGIQAAVAVCRFLILDISYFSVLNCYFRKELQMDRHYFIGFTCQLNSTPEKL